MKKIFCFIVVLVLLAAPSMLNVSAVNEGWVYRENFETISNESMIEKYLFNSCAPRIISGVKGQDVQEGSKAVLIANRAGHWSGMRLKLWNGGKPLIDINRTYTLSFHIKFDGDIDKVGVQLTFGEDAGYGWHEIFSAFDAGLGWTYITGTFRLADEFKNSTDPKIHSLTALPADALLSIICEASKKDLYIDMVELYEGTPTTKPPWVDESGAVVDPNANNQGQGNTNTTDSGNPDNAEDGEGSEEEFVLMDSSIGDNLIALAIKNPVAGKIAVDTGRSFLQNFMQDIGVFWLITIPSIVVVFGGGGFILFRNRAAVGRLLKRIKKPSA